jgi:hypothetical protein
MLRDPLRLLWPVAWALVGVVALSSAPVLAQSAQDRTSCLTEDSIAVRQRITACSALIDSHRLRGEELARVFSIRAWAHTRTNRFDLAAADAEEAVRLEPSNRLYVAVRDRYTHTKLMNEHWSRYLKEIQDDNDYANWSGPPSDLQRAREGR